MQTAIQAIYRDMDYAKSLIKKRGGKMEAMEEDESEESWTFVGSDEPDPDVHTMRLSSGLPGF